MISVSKEMNNSWNFVKYITHLLLLCVCIHKCVCVCVCVCVVCACIRR